MKTNYKKPARWIFKAFMSAIVATLFYGLFSVFSVVRTLPGGFSKSAQAKVQLVEIRKAILAFKKSVGRYPTPDELEHPDLGAGANVAWLRKAQVDPWNRPFIYEANGEHFQLTTYGKDKAPGGEESDADLTVSDDEPNF